ncbi:MAG TPA: hypothetical protein VMW25_02040, partial [Clostridia bacterium]|nr:hypothetical protein [Clostridia bacterium]
QQQAIRLAQKPTEAIKAKAPAKVVKPAKPTITPAEAKQPWEMTPEELANVPSGWYKDKQHLIPLSKFKEIGINRNYVKKPDGYYHVLGDGNLGAKVTKTELDRSRNESIDSHKYYVQKALSENKPVPPEVLAEYKGEPWADEALAEAGKGEVYKIGDKYAVPSPKRLGFKKGFGDALFDTKEQAEAYKAIQDKQEEGRKQGELEAEEREKRAEEKKKQDDFIDGFGEELTPMKKGKVIKTLNKKINASGKRTTVKDLVRDLVKKGEAIESHEENKIKPMSRKASFRADQATQDAHEKQIREGGKKTVYTVGGYDLGKTAYDYALFLKDKPATP